MPTPNGTRARLITSGLCLFQKLIYKRLHERSTSRIDAKSRHNTKRKKAIKFRPKSLLRWLLLTTVAVVVSIWAVATFYAIQKHSQLLLFTPVRVLVSSPKYLSAIEDEELRFAFENTSNRKVDVAFGLENDGTIPSFLGLQESNIVYAGSLRGREQINRQLKVSFVDQPPYGEIFNSLSQLSLWGSIGNSQIEKKNLAIYYAPIPWSKSLSNYLGTLLVALAGLLFREVWNQVKEPDGKKR